LASGYPAIAGVFTAIIGGILSPFLSNSELTIKGPAAGLIVIAVGCVLDFGFTGGQNPTADFQAYRLALAVGAAAGVIQIFFGLFRTGIIGEFFPSPAVHGMLAAIGVIIMAKQLPVAMGVQAKGGPLELIAQIPSFFQKMNPEIAFIGLVSLLLLFGLPLVKNRYVKMIPGPMLVVLLAVPLGMYFDLSHEHTYSWAGHTYNVGENFLVSVPNNLFNALTSPDFSALGMTKAWKWVVMFALIGSLESLLSAKAIDLIDPWRRRTNLDRDMLAVGIGNTVCAFVGGLPMISEIVRSRANIDNGARTRYANMFHGVFLLLFVALVPNLIHRIPLAALAAMLIYTGYRLAHPRELFHLYKIGPEQLAVFVTTIVAVLATDLLLGIAIGILLNFGVHIFGGTPLNTLFVPKLSVDEDGNGVVVNVRGSAVFSNWIPLRRCLEKQAKAGKKAICVNFAEAHVVDHSVMSHLEELRMEFEEMGIGFTVDGLNDHDSVSDHPLASRKLQKRA
ncbi:MAG: SulP family inorganic anion transporter, partial [Bdellovibrionales bacterium]|nr:SulP family inorganic anion transporter [Bdellovibrionales bacterium]